MNGQAIKAIYLFEMARTWRTLWQSIVSPVISTSLYFVVFGAAIGARMQEIDGVAYALSSCRADHALAADAEHLQRVLRHLFPALHRHDLRGFVGPVSPFEIVTAYVGAAATKSVILGLIILATAALFVPLRIEHPLWMLAFLVLTAVTFSLFGFIIGIWADGFEQLQFVPMLVVTPLTFLGGSFYAIDMLPPFWRTVSLFNPVVYLVSGFRWSFFGTADVAIGVSLAMTLVFLGLCLAAIGWIFRTGYRLKA